jgi:hypothetical protein
LTVGTRYLDRQRRNTSFFVAYIRAMPVTNKHNGSAGKNRLFFCSEPPPPKCLAASATGHEHQKIRDECGVPKGLQDRHRRAPAKMGRPRIWATDRQRYLRGKGFNTPSFLFTFSERFDASHQRQVNNPRFTLYPDRSVKWCERFSGERLLERTSCKATRWSALSFPQTRFYARIALAFR